MLPDISYVDFPVYIITQSTNAVLASVKTYIFILYLADFEMILTLNFTQTNIQINVSSSESCLPGINNFKNLPCRYSSNSDTLYEG